MVEDRPKASAGFNATIAGLSLVLASGAILDAFPHRNIPGVNTEGFVTPWHTIFYAGMTLLAGLLGLPAYRTRLRGPPWRDSLPEGYWLAASGAPGFGVAG